jgi:2-keto-3-deoxy-L-rhamnonate aldolase RhmA
MRHRHASAAALALSVALIWSEAAEPRQNKVVELLAAKQPVFGLYAPSNRRQGQEPTSRTPQELAREAVAFRGSDFYFDGGMEGGLERGLPAFAEFVKAMSDVAPATRSAFPLMVKTPRIASDPAKAIENISRQLNLGVSGIVFVEVESADEVRRGLAAMRFKSRGGTRPDDVGAAPAYWGLTEREYRARADLWPLAPQGELVNWTIVESKQGLAHVREIAAVPGIAALFPGAGTLRRVYTTTNAAGERVFDAAGWEAAIQQVLSACKEFGVACGYPATGDDIEMRMKQGFSVFISAWGEGGFKAIEAGRRAAGKPALEIQTASGTALEEKGRVQLERIVKTHALERFLFTRSVRIQSRVIPHSHPLLTLNTQYVEDDAAQLATFLHEQFHWYAVERRQAVEAAKAELRALYPQVPAAPPRGANGEDSTYLHLIVCSLELEATAKLLGDETARRVLGDWKHYTWVYETVLRDREKLGALLRRHGLGLP